MKSMSAMTLEVLLHYHYSPDQFETQCKAHRDAHDQLWHAGLLHDKSSLSVCRHYEISPLGSLHVRAVLDLPLPTQKTVWVDGLGRESELK